MIAFIQVWKNIILIAVVVCCCCDAFSMISQPDFGSPPTTRIIVAVLAATASVTTTAFAPSSKNGTKSYNFGSICFNDTDCSGGGSPFCDVNVSQSNVSQSNVSQSIKTRNARRVADVDGSSADVGVCVDCTTDEHCAFGTVCQDGSCFVPDPSCTSHSKCEETGFICDPFNLNCTQVYCRTDNDCRIISGDLYCNITDDSNSFGGGGNAGLSLPGGGLCAPIVCVVDADCPAAGWVCEIDKTSAGVAYCIPPRCFNGDTCHHVGDNDETGWLTCNTFTQICVCRSDWDCPQPRCVPTEDEMSSCAQYTCDKYSGTCVVEEYYGATCRDSSECHGLICRPDSNTCTYCSVDEDCYSYDHGERCSNGVCGKPLCEYHSDCPNGFVCDWLVGQCDKLPCSTTFDDCPESLVCKADTANSNEGFCVPITCKTADDCDGTCEEESNCCSPPKIYEVNQLWVIQIVGECIDPFLAQELNSSAVKRVLHAWETIFGPFKLYLPGSDHCPETCRLSNDRETCIAIVCPDFNDQKGTISLCPKNCNLPRNRARCVALDCARSRSDLMRLRMLLQQSSLGQRKALLLSNSNNDTDDASGTCYLFDLSQAIDELNLAVGDLEGLCGVDLMVEVTTLEDFYDATRPELPPPSDFPTFIPEEIFWDTPAGEPSSLIGIEAEDQCSRSEIVFDCPDLDLFLNSPFFSTNNYSTTYSKLVEQIACYPNRSAYPSEKTEPTSMPSTEPSDSPSILPTIVPSNLPTTIHFYTPSSSPTVAPTTMPWKVPSSLPSKMPFESPSSVPSRSPYSMLSQTPQQFIDDTETVSPTDSPTTTLEPSTQPSVVPFAFPSGLASVDPTTHSFSEMPTQTMTNSPSAQTVSPTLAAESIAPTSCLTKGAPCNGGSENDCCSGLHCFTAVKKKNYLVNGGSSTDSKGTKVEESDENTKRQAATTATCKVCGKLGDSCGSNGSGKKNSRAAAPCCNAGKKATCRKGKCVKCFRKGKKCKKKKNCCSKKCDKKTKKCK